MAFFAPLLGPAIYTLGGVILGGVGMHELTKPEPAANTPGAAIDWKTLAALGAAAAGAALLIKQVSR